jgi:hypothetical protein
MPNYWIKCPLDIKEKIQQYLKYNMFRELIERVDKITHTKDLNDKLYIRGYENYGILYHYFTHRCRKIDKYCYKWDLVIKGFKNTQLNV